MKSGGSNYALRGRAAREDVGGGDSNADALWGELAIGGGDALLPLAPSAHWEGFGFSKFDACGAACEVLGDELGTSSPHLSVSDFTGKDQSPRPPSPLTRQPLEPSLLYTLRRKFVAWGRTKRINFVPEHHMCGGDAPPPPPAVHRRDEGDHVSMIGATKRTRKEEVAGLGIQAPVGKARQRMTCNNSVKIKGKKTKGKIGGWGEERYKNGLQKVLSVLQARGATKGNPMKRSELLEAVRGDIADSGLREHLLKHIVGQAPEGSSEKVCRQCDPLTGHYVYWLEGIEVADLPRNITDTRSELTDITIQGLNEIKRLMMEVKGVVMELKARVDVLEERVDVLAPIQK